MEMQSEQRPLTGRSSTSTDYGAIDVDGDQITQFEEDETVPLRMEDDDDYRPTQDEILFRMRYAHINKGFDWSEDIENARGPAEAKWSLQVKILEKLKEQPIPIKEKLKLSRYLRDHLDAASISSRQNGGRKSKSYKHRMWNLTIDAWRNSITHIAAYHGSNVASYFVFLRFLVYLDLFLAVVIFAFINLPQILPGDTAIPNHVAGYFGELSTSIMFYGAYSNTTWGYYERPLAYFLTFMLLNTVCFVVIAFSMYIRYSRSKHGNKEEEFLYSWRLFSSWDHGITSSDGVRDRRTAIKTALKEMVQEEKVHKRRVGSNRFLLFIARFIINIVILGLLVGSGYLIYLVADMTSSPVEVLDVLDDFLSKYELPLVVAGLKVTVPLVFVVLLRAEKWHPRTEIKLTIGLTTLFFVASLIVFLTSLLNITTECLDATSNSTLAQRNASEFCCWENEVGEQVFKVLLIDFVLGIIVVLVFDVLRAVIVKCGAWKRIGFSDFDVAFAVLDLIYGQALIWLGLYFEPFLAAVGFVKLIMTFYFRYVIARTCNVPPSKVFRASRSGNFYMFILLLHLFFCLFPLGYTVIELQPSADCGPFRGESHVFHVITSRVGKLPDWLKSGLSYISTPAIIIPVVILLLLIILFYMARSNSYRNVIEDLRSQLRFERRVEKRKVFAKARAGIKYTPSVTEEERDQETESAQLE